MVRIYPQENKAEPPKGENKAGAKGKGTQAKASVDPPIPPAEQVEQKE